VGGFLDFGAAEPPRNITGRVGDEGKEKEDAQDEERQSDDFLQGAVE
jgi:hypothetical protein